MLLQVSGSQLLVCMCVCMCVSVWEGKEHVHMCIYGGGHHGKKRDELMAICPLSCPWGLEDSGSSQAELDACHSRRVGDGGASGRCVGQGGAGAALCTGPLGAIGSPVIDWGGQQLRQSHWQTLCPFGFLLVKHRVTGSFKLASKKQTYIIERGLLSVLWY